MTITFDKQEVEFIYTIASEHNINPETLEKWYCDMMASNFCQDIADVANDCSDEEDC